MLQVLLAGGLWPVLWNRRERRCINLEQISFCNSGIIMIISDMGLLSLSVHPFAGHDAFPVKREKITLKAKSLSVKLVIASVHLKVGCLFPVLRGHLAIYSKVIHYNLVKILYEHTGLRCFVY